jgi:hypothetical protein
VSTDNPNREHEGTSAGGQFAAAARPEPTVTLSACEVIADAWVGY